MNGLFGGASRTAARMTPQLKPQPSGPAIASAAAPRRGLFSFSEKVSGQDRLMALSAMLADLGQGGTQNLQGLRQEQRQSQMDEQNRLKAQQDALIAEQQRNRPQFYNTRAGVVGVQSDGTSNVVFANPEDPEETMGGVPVGMIRNEDGSLGWAPGYVDSQLELGRGRRRTIIENPTPSRARASGGGGGSRSAPASAPRQTPRSNPWDRDY